MRRPGHENCESCPVCQLTACPDCDDEGRACSFDHASRKPWRNVGDRGAVAMEYGLLSALIAAVLITGVAAYKAVEFDINLRPTQPAPTEPASR